MYGKPYGTFECFFLFPIVTVLYNENSIFHTDISGFKNLNDRKIRLFFSIHIYCLKKKDFQTSHAAFHTEYYILILR